MTCTEPTNRSNMMCAHRVVACETGESTTAKYAFLQGVESLSRRPLLCCLLPEQTRYCGDTRVAQRCLWGCATKQTGSPWYLSRAVHLVLRTYPFYRPSIIRILRLLNNHLCYPQQIRSHGCPLSTNQPNSTQQRLPLAFGLSRFLSTPSQGLPKHSSLAKPFERCAEARHGRSGSAATRKRRSHTRVNFVANTNVPGSAGPSQGRKRAIA